MAVVILKSVGGSPYYVQTVIVQGRTWLWDIHPTEKIISSNMLFWWCDGLGPTIVSKSLKQLLAMCEGLGEDAWKSLGTSPEVMPWQ